MKIVHFVRDPFDMIVSGFLYHSQIPFPLHEKWLTHVPNYNLCGYNPHAANKYLTKLSELRGGAVGLPALNQTFLAVVDKCREMKEKYNHLTLSEMFQEAKRVSVQEGESCCDHMFMLSGVYCWCHCTRRHFVGGRNTVPHASVTMVSC